MDLSQRLSAIAGSTRFRLQRYSYKLLSFRFPLSWLYIDRRHGLIRVFTQRARSDRSCDGDARIGLLLMFMKLT